MISVGMFGIYIHNTIYAFYNIMLYIPRLYTHSTHMVFFLKNSLRVFSQQHLIHMLQYIMNFSKISTPTYSQ